MTGEDLSPVSLHDARELAAGAGLPVEFVASEVHDAPQAHGGRRFDPATFSVAMLGGAICRMGLFPSGGIRIPGRASDTGTLIASLR